MINKLTKIYINFYELNNISTLNEITSFKEFLFLQILYYFTYIYLITNLLKKGEIATAASLADSSQLIAHIATYCPNSSSIFLLHSSLLPI
jgi:hypothetical protein